MTAPPHGSEGGSRAAAEIARAATSGPDPVSGFLDDLARELSTRPRRSAELEGFRPAAVLIPLVRREDGLYLTFMRRTEDGSVHSGQIAFPGGATEPEDADATDTALREAEEEVSIPAASVTPLGWMDDNATISQYRVTPVVGFVSPPPRYRPDPVEVQEIFEVPLAWLLDPGNETRAPDAEFLGRRWALYEYQWQGRVIWGVTGRILFEFLTVARSLPAAAALAAPQVAPDSDQNGAADP